MADDSRDNPVVLSTIYTRTGDDGTTGLTDFSRVPKTDSRLAAYADTDEANCAIGTAITLGQLPADMAALLRRIQNELFDCGADLATPLPPAPPEYPQLRIDDSYVSALETACDAYNADLPTLRTFILPGGTPGGALLHRQGGDPPRGAHRVGGRRRPRRQHQPLARHVPEPAVGPAVHPRPGRQRGHR